MPYRPFLYRIGKLIQTRRDAHFDGIEEGFRSGRLRLPAQPMTDQELARAIREFRGAPLSGWTMRKLANRFEQK